MPMRTARQPIGRPCGRPRAPRVAVEVTQVRRDRSTERLVVAGPVGLRTGATARGRGADEPLELVRQVLGDPGDVVAEPAPSLDRDRGAAHGMAPRPLPVDRGGQERRTGAQGQGGRPRRAAVVRSPKNVTGTPPPTRSRSLSRHTTSPRLTALITSRPASGPRGTTVMPSDSRNARNHSNSSAGSSGSTTAVTGTRGTREPEGGPLPGAEVGHHQDRPGAGGAPRPRCGRSPRRRTRRRPRRRRGSGRRNDSA
jgi:hypothetical protein